MDSSCLNNRGSNKVFYNKLQLWKNLAQTGGSSVHLQHQSTNTK